ncbi:MAG: hypothetical protein IJQ53_05045 [Clostridia bacterium]|nr:hypothetical protein [Clostridia bacterium]
MKNNFIKILALALVLVFALSFAACGSKDNEVSKAGSNGDQSVESKEDVTADSEAVSEEESKAESLPETSEPTASDERLVFNFNGVSVELPEGFHLTDGSTEQNALAVPADYPAHTDNISFVTGADQSAAFTEEIMKPAFEQLLGELKDFNLSKSKLDGVEYALVTYKCEVNGVKMDQTLYTFFFTDKSVTITFSVINDSENRAVLDKAIETLHIEG